MYQVYINPKHISKVEIIPSIEYRYIHWQDETVKTSWFGFVKKTIPAGFYEAHLSSNGYIDEPVSIEKIINRKLNIKDKIVYYRPYINIYHVDGSYTTSKRFKDEDEAKQFYLKEIQPLLSTNTYISII